MDGMHDMYKYYDEYCLSFPSLPPPLSLTLSLLSVILFLSPSLYLFYMYLPTCTYLNTATVNEDYLELETNITFISGQNSTGDNQQCFYVVLLDDNVLEGNETFDIQIRPSPQDEDIVNITGGIITVTIEEDPTDSKWITLDMLYNKTPDLSLISLVIASSSLIMFYWLVYRMKDLWSFIAQQAVFTASPPLPPL